MPAALRWWMTIPQTVVDTIFKALAPACPERVIAGHHADLASGGAYGYIDPETGRVLAGAYGGAGLAGGGWGAKLGEDDMNATVCINDGATHNSPVEACEAKAPLLIVQRALRQDSGGAGKWRGGLGVVQQVEVLTPAVFDSRVERTLCPPWGLHGGKAALLNGVCVVRKDGALERFPTGKVIRSALTRATVMRSKLEGAAALATHSNGRPSTYCGTSPQGMSRWRPPGVTMAS
jgi:N-methylhydantoinase B